MIAITTSSSIKVKPFRFARKCCSFAAATFLDAVGGRKANASHVIRPVCGPPAVGKFTVNGCGRIRSGCPIVSWQLLILKRTSGYTGLSALLLRRSRDPVRERLAGLETAADHHRLQPQPRKAP